MSATDLNQPAKRSTTPTVPPLLRPWQSWLVQLMPATSEFLARSGQLLRPLINGASPFSTLERSQAIGVGGLSRRGDFSRLSMSDWLWAEIEPQEFLRRAAMHELLFLAPEPEPVPHKPEIVLLFDTGPLQLGAPRLAHLALWIALARRAELLGATLLWGSAQRLVQPLQRPDSADAAELLSTRTDAFALDELAAARSPGVLDPQAVSGLAPLLMAHIGAEFWYIGSAAMKEAAGADLLDLLPPPLRRKIRRIAITETLGKDRHLQVQHGAQHILLPLPSALKAAEILRHPSKLRELISESKRRQDKDDLELRRLECSPFSLEQALQFSTDSEVVLLGGTREQALLLITKNQPRAAAQLKIPDLAGEVLAVDLVGRRLSVIERWSSEIVNFRDFGARANSLPQVRIRPNELPGHVLSLDLAARHQLINDAQCAYLLSHGSLLVLRLNPQQPQTKAFRVHQIAEHVRYLERNNGEILLMLEKPNLDSPQLEIYPIVAGVLGGLCLALERAVGRPFRLASGEWLYQHSDGYWLIGTPNAWRVLPWRLQPGEVALGIAMRGTKQPQLCVQAVDYFYFLPLDSDAIEDAESHLHPQLSGFGAIAQSALSPPGARLAWLTSERELRIYSFSRRRMLLRCAGLAAQLERES